MYIRPDITVPSFVDEAGEVIEYGRRWPDMPPPESYSVFANTERYEPLHRVAEALLQHLVAEHDVLIAEQAVPPSRPSSEMPHVLRSVRLTPADPDAAPMTVEFLSFPSVVVRAGIGFGEAFPSCGCDACDERTATAVEQLEQVVLAIAAGGLTEHLGTAEPDGYGNRLAYGDGWRGTSSPAPLTSVHAHRAADGTGRRGDIAWRPWPPRSS